MVSSTILAPPATTRLDDEDGIGRALAFGWWLVRRATRATALAVSDIGDIDLPPMVGSAEDGARLQAVAPLYLASELEQARLLPAVELLAGLYVSGGLTADIGPAGPRLLTFWQGRHERFAARERQALFNRLFGAPSPALLSAPGGENTDFDDAMVTLTEALHKLDLDPPLGLLPASETALRLAARQLADNLLPRGSGIATFAARDLLATLQAAVDLLKETTLQQALGGRGVWGTVRAIARSYLDETPAIEAHVTRGRAGMLVITWLAHALPLLDDPGRRLVAPDHPVLPAATAWLQASLALAERRSVSSQRG